jgi:hypothetical protein
MNRCKSISCFFYPEMGEDFCLSCQDKARTDIRSGDKPMSEKYPKYYKDVSELTEIDVYATHMLFNIQDPSGCIQHASKKLLLSGVRTGGKSMKKDISEARDTLTRWLQLYAEDETES